MTPRTEVNIDRALTATEALKSATNDTKRLAAAKALESAACQLRRELKKVLGA